MALLRKIAKEAFEKLNDVLKAEYKEKDGSYFLDTDDASELERALAREKARADKAAADLTDVTKERDELTASAGDKHKDIKTLEESWKTKVATVEKEKGERITKLETQMRNSAIESEAMRLASEISTSPKLLLPHIKARLSIDLEGDAPTVKVLDAAGKLSASSVDDLRQEFVANKDFASIIVGSKASGSNANNRSFNSNGNANANQSNQPENLAKMTPHQLAERTKAKLAEKT